MRSWYACFLLALAVLFLYQPADAAVEDTCKAVAGGDPNIKYDFCVAALKSDPSSSSADNKELAIIATRLSVTNATSTKAKIDGLLKGSPEAKTTECLKTCLELYTDLIPTLNESVDSIRSGQYGDAKTQLSAALDKPATCEDTFSESKVPSPLAQEDANSKQLSTIALAITNML